MTSHHSSKPIALALVLACPLASHAAITDLGTWTLVEDPADPGLSASVDSFTQITLRAGDQLVPSATDIGFQSVTGATPSSSSSGYAFDPGSDFAVAIDYQLSLSFASGGLGIGFGIGEDSDGANSAGAALLTSGSFGAATGAAARIDDETQPLGFLQIFPSLTGAFFVSYEAATGDVTVGSGDTGDSAPSSTHTFDGIQNSWSGELLMPSFFLRSDDTLGTPWTAGDAEAVFSNFRVINGSATAVPEPGTLGLFALSGLIALKRRRANR